eukprot:gene10265-12589_t
MSTTETHSQIPLFNNNNNNNNLTTLSKQDFIVNINNNNNNNNFNFNNKQDFFNLVNNYPILNSQTSTTTESQQQILPFLFDSSNNNTTTKLSSSNLLFPISNSSNSIKNSQKMTESFLSSPIPDYFEWCAGIINNSNNNNNGSQVTIGDQNQQQQQMPMYQIKNESNNTGFQQQIKEDINSSPNGVDQDQNSYLPVIESSSNSSTPQIPTVQPTSLYQQLQQFSPPGSPNSINYASSSTSSSTLAPTNNNIVWPQQPNAIIQTAVPLLSNPENNIPLYTPSTTSNNNNKTFSEPSTPTIDDNSRNSPVVYSIPSYYIPNYGIVLSAPIKGGNPQMLPPQAWPQNNNNNNNGVINLTSLPNNNNNNGNNNLQFFQNVLQFQNQLINNNNNNNGVNINGVNNNNMGTQIKNPFLGNNNLGNSVSLNSMGAKNHVLKDPVLGGTSSPLQSEESSPETHVHTPSSSPNTPPQDQQFIQHWESGLEPNSLQKQNEISPPIFVKSNVVYFEPYIAGEPGLHKTCWNLIEPMHRNYYQPIQFKLPPDTNLPITQLEGNTGVLDTQRLLAATLMNQNQETHYINKYESYRIYIHPSLGYSGNAKRFKQLPDPNEKALILDGNVYDGYLNPIYHCKICTEYYQTKSYFSANPHAKGKVLLVKNNILTRVKDGGFTLSLKPMCCSGHNSHIPLYFHFTLTNPATNEIVLQSLINVNVKQWKKSIPNKSKKQRYE